MKDLPHGLQSSFRNTFVRRIVKLVFSGISPWSNPSLPFLQHEFDLVYASNYSSIWCSYPGDYSRLNALWVYILTFNVADQPGPW